MIRTSPLLVLALTACGAAPSPAPAPAAAPVATAAPDAEVRALLEAAAIGAHRSPENQQRNPARHPVETLLFFGLQPDMTVVELWPGAGWYTEVIAPAVPQGQLIAASTGPHPEDPTHYRTRNHEALAKRLATEPALATARLGLLVPPDQIDLGAPGSADLVVSFRNSHGWYRSGDAPAIYAAAFEVLKPGGVFGVVQHRAAEGTNPDETAPKGYLSEQAVIELVTAAGFVLDARSEINANPNDTRDHPEGVWTLPPSLRLGDVDREKYVAIGESDRMTLKFRKPE